jgi:hypothetical protein
VSVHGRVHVECSTNDDFSAKETHQLAQANDEKNRRLREAFGIGEFNQKDIAKRKNDEIKEVERRKAELANRQYTWVDVRRAPRRWHVNMCNRIVQDDDDDDDNERQRQQEKDKDEQVQTKERDERQPKSRDEKKRRVSPSTAKDRSTSEKQ